MDYIVILRTTLRKESIEKQRKEIWEESAYPTFSYDAALLESHPQTV